MSNNPPLDEAAFAKLYHLGGDSFVLEMLGLFFDYVPDLLERARVGAEGGDLRAIEMATHSLKSSARGVGATRLQEIATRIEKLAAQQEREALPALLRELNEAYAEVKPHLESRKEEIRKKLEANS